MKKKGKQSLLHKEKAAFFGSVIEGINADEKPKQPVLKPIDLSVAKEDTASAKQSQLNYVNNPPLNTLTGRLKWGLATLVVGVSNDDKAIMITYSADKDSTLMLSL